jgi:arsenic resistance protein ArsH
LVAQQRLPPAEHDTLFDGTQIPNQPTDQKPRILLLYGSNRERSFSRLLVEEAARLLEHFGAETRIFNPSGLPLPDDAPVAPLRARRWR